MKAGHSALGRDSAGARPGPAAYGLGGAEPTVTDANVALGYLSADSVPGRTPAVAPRPRRELNLSVVWLDPLGLQLDQAAAGILRIVDENMASAIRAVSIERGVDPRRFVLVVGGGAGAGCVPARLAREVGVGEEDHHPERSQAHCAPSE